MYQSYTINSTLLKSLKITFQKILQEIIEGYSNNVM